MKTIRTMLRSLALILIVMIILPAGSQAQDTGNRTLPTSSARKNSRRCSHRLHCIQIL